MFYKDECIRVAIRNGLTPMQAIQMSTIQPAEHLRVGHDVGVIAAGRYADIVLVDDLEDFSIRTVLANGEPVVEDGRLFWAASQPDYPPWLYETMNVARRPGPDDFRVAAGGERAQVRVIVVTDGSLESHEAVETLRVEDGHVQPDPDRGINKIAMIDRVLASA